MIQVSDLLAALAALGLTVTVDEGRLVVHPKVRITPSIRQLIAAHKDELVTALHQEDPMQGTTELDAEIIETASPRRSIPEMRISLNRCLDRLVDSGDAEWAEAVNIWSRAILYRQSGQADAGERAA